MQKLAEVLLQRDLPQGEACTYSHAAEGTQGETPAKPAGGDGVAKSCWHFTNTGKCKFCDKCKKLHDQPSVASVPKAKAKAQAKAKAIAVSAAAKALEEAK